MRRFEFKVTLSGYGDTVDEAWEDAVEGFSQEPGATPDTDYTEKEEDE